MLLTVVGLVECTPYAPGLSNTVSAVVFGTTAVGATGLYRRRTGGCWANCQSGTQCDRDTGMCVPIPCGGCPVDMRCAATPRGQECVARSRERHGSLEAGTREVSDAAGADARSEAPDTGQEDGGID